MLLETLKQLVKEAPKGLMKNKGYKRYLRVEGGGIKINLKKIEAENKYDGKYVITSNTELKAVSCSPRGAGHNQAIFHTHEAF